MYQHRQVGRRRSTADAGCGRGPPGSEARPAGTGMVRPGTLRALDGIQVRHRPGAGRTERLFYFAGRDQWSGKFTAKSNLQPCHGQRIIPFSGTAARQTDPLRSTAPRQQARAKAQITVAAWVTKSTSGVRCEYRSGGQSGNGPIAPIELQSRERPVNQPGKAKRSTEDILAIQAVVVLYGRDRASKALLPTPGGSVDVVYHDTVLRTPDGWRSLTRRSSAITSTRRLPGALSRPRSGSHGVRSSPCDPSSLGTSETGGAPEDGARAGTRPPCAGAA